MPAPPPITHAVMNTPTQQDADENIEPEQLQRVINDTIDQEVTLTATENPTTPTKEIGGQRVQGDVPGPRAGQDTPKGSTEQRMHADDDGDDAKRQRKTTLHTPPARQLVENGPPHGLEGDVSDGPATQPKDRPPKAAQPERLHPTSRKRLGGESSLEQGGAEPDGLATGSPSVVNRVGNPSLKRGEHGGTQGLEVAPSPYRGTLTVTESAGGASQHKQN